MGLRTGGRAGRLQGVCDAGQGWGGWGWGRISGSGFLRRVPAANESAAQPDFDPSCGVFSGKMLQEYRTSLVVLGCRGTSGELHTAPLAARRAGWVWGGGAALKGACQIL